MKVQVQCCLAKPRKNAMFGVLDFDTKSKNGFPILTQTFGSRLDMFGPTEHGWFVAGFGAPSCSTRKGTPAHEEHGSTKGSSRDFVRFLGSLDWQTFHLLQTICYFPLLVLKGTYHYWTSWIFSRGLNQMEENKSLLVNGASSSNSSLSWPQGAMRCRSQFRARATAWACHEG